LSLYFNIEQIKKRKELIYSHLFVDLYYLYLEKKQQQSEQTKIFVIFVFGEKNLRKKF